MKIRNFNKMKRINFLVWICLLMSNQLTAQKSQSFIEHWFGVQPQQIIQQQAKAQVSKATMQAKLPTATKSDDIITLDLSQPTNPASFDLDADGVWIHTYSDDYTWIAFNDLFTLSHLIPPSNSFGGYYWDGFTYSQNGDNSNYGSSGDSQSWVSKQWGNMAAGGIQTDIAGNILKDEEGVVLTSTDNPYLVACWGYFMEDEYYENNYLPEPTHNLQILFSDEKMYEAVGIYVNNHPWPFYGNINGDGFARALDQEGDYFKLLVHGLDENLQNNGQVVEHFLAEYRDGALVQSPDWEWIDLTNLGEVSGIYFTMETTDSDPMWGPNTASYFCMDKLQIRDKDISTATSTDEKEQISLYPNPVTDYLLVNSPQTQTAKLFSISGQFIKDINLNKGENRINMEHLPQGSYLLQTIHTNLKLMK